jgi:hypothetical protein
MLIFFKNETKNQCKMKVEPIDFLQIKNMSKTEDSIVQKPLKNLLSSILDAYKSIFKFFNLPHMRILIFILVTIKVIIIIELYCLNLIIF